VVPVALNSGLYWPRRKFLRYPGAIVIEFLPAIPPGLPPRAFLKELEAAIEKASDRLLIEAWRSPQRPPFPPTARAKVAALEADAAFERLRPPKRCSIFVLMVAALPPILSDARPDFARKAGVGDRFHYWRGATGRRYLFTAVAPDSLRDFRSAVVLLAEPGPGERLTARAVMTLDAQGRQAGGDLLSIDRLSPATIALVHFLAASEGERRSIVDDLMALSLRLAA
jgi:hypothetical protein